MKRKYKLLLSTIGLLSISTITISSVISCSNGSDSSKNETSSYSDNNKNDIKNSDNSTKSKSNSNSPKTPSSSNSNNNSINNSSSLKTEQISNALTSYFSEINNQMALINYLVNNDYITYTNGTWNYDTTSSSLNNYSSFTSWDNALNNGISNFIFDNENISYDGILGSNIDNNGFSVTSASYNASKGLAFNISSSSSVTISINVLNNFINGNTNIANVISNYFSKANNQSALINYLVNNDYIIYNNDTLSYNTSTPAPNGNGYTSWTSALSAGISAFIYSNQNISYDGVLGSNINTNDLSIINASYNANIATGELVFTIAYNDADAISNITISVNALNQYNDEENNLPSITIANAITTYFSNDNNQMALVNYLWKNAYITYSNGTWSYWGYSSWASALSVAISNFIYSNQNISYDGVLGSSINTNYYLSIANVSYSTSSGLVFTITYVNVSANNATTISETTMNNYNKNTNLSNAATANALTTYFSNTNNQMALINYLVNNDYITYTNKTWNYDTTSSSLNNSGSFTSWASALSNGISSFIANNQNIWYDGVLGSSINVGNYKNGSNEWVLGDFSITNASYSAASGLTFTITYGNVSASNATTISETTMNNYNKNTNLSNAATANALTTYFNNTNNQSALINYLAHNDYITYTNRTWNYNTSSSAPNYIGYTSWASALSNGISAFIGENKNIPYDGILGSSINSWDISITSASYSSANGLVFSIAYDGISANSNVTISANTLNNYGKSINSSNIAIVNALTTYFSNDNNQSALINYLLKDDYITYLNGAWSYDTSNYTSWASALSSGISAFISANSNISYDGVLGSSMNTNYYDSDLSITSASYSTSGLEFTISYNNVNASSSVTISASTLNHDNSDTN